MTQRTPSHLGIKLLGMAAAGGILLFWVLMDWPCIFRYLTGIPCISCGMSRAWLAALRLDLVQALYYHPMFWSVPVLALFLIFDGKLFPSRRLNTLVLGAILLGLCASYPLRLTAYLLGVYIF